MRWVARKGTKRCWVDAQKHIYANQNIHNPASEGWELSAESNGDTPLDSGAPDRRDSNKRDDRRSKLDPTFFNLSGGILKEKHSGSTSSIDDILTRLIASQPSGSRAPKHVDRNLDYLHTCLQLDMIRMVAEGIQQPPEKDGEDIARDKIVRSLRGSVEYTNPHSTTD